MTLRQRFARKVYDRIGDLYLTAVVRHTGNFENITWLGKPIWQNVVDLWALQEALVEIRPSLILETGTNRGGSALFYASVFDLMGEGRVVTVDVKRMHDLTHPRIDFLIGGSTNADVVAKMQAAAEGATGPVVVVLDSDHSRDHVAAEIDAYAPLVTSGSLMLVQDGVIDANPIFRSGRPGPRSAIWDFLAEHPEFYVDSRYNRRFLATHHPDGWLRRR